MLELLLDVVKDTRPEDVLVLEVATIGLLVTLGAVVTQNPVLTRIAQGLGVLFSYRLVHGEKRRKLHYESRVKLTQG